MKNVKIPVWLLGFLLVALFIVSGCLAIAVSGNSNLRDDVAWLEAGIRAAREAQRILAGQLGELAIDSHRLAAELGAAMATNEHGQELGDQLEGEIADSADAGRAIRDSIGRIGKWIERVEEINSQG